MSQDTINIIINSTLTFVVASAFFSIVDEIRIRRSRKARSVWVLKRDANYQGEVFIGVFTTVNKAKRFLDDNIAKESQDEFFADLVDVDAAPGAFRLRVWLR